MTLARGSSTWRSSAGRLGLALVVLLASAGCPRGEGPAGSGAQAAPLEHLVDGCRMWLNDGVCVASDPLTVWLADPDARPALPGWRVGPGEAVDGGRRYRLAPVGPPSRARLVAEGPRGRRVGVEVALEPARPEVDVSSMSTEALLELAPTLALHARVPVYDAVRRRALQGESRRASLTATVWLTQTHAALGHRSEWIRFGAVAAYIELAGQSIERARRALQALPRPHAADARSRTFSTYYRALLARDTGATQLSVRHLFAMQRIATRVGSPFETVALQVVLPLLWTAGHEDRVPEIERQLIETSSAAACPSRTRILENVAWARLVARDAEIGVSTAEHLTTVTDRMKETEALLLEADRGNAACGAEPHNFKLNLALDALQRGLPERASALIEQVPNSKRQAKFERFDRLLRARIALAAGRDREAARRFAAVLREPGSTPFERWRAQVGLGVSWRRRDPARAIEMLLAAESTADRIAKEARLVSGQRAALETTLYGTRHLVDLLVGLGRAEEAWRVGVGALRRLRAVQQASLRLGQLSSQRRRRVDARLGRFLERRAAFEGARAKLWTASKDEASRARDRLQGLEEDVARALDEILGSVGGNGAQAGFDEVPSGHHQVLVMPGRGRWWLLSRSASGVVAEEVRALSPTPDDFGPALELALPKREEVTRVVFLPLGRIGQLDLHRAQVRGEPVGLTSPVTYSLGALRSLPAAGAPRRALLLGDPSAHLRTAEELAAVEARLVSAGVDVDTVMGMTLLELRTKVRDVDLLHFAGHAEYGPSVSRSRLRIGDSAWVTAADVLTVDAALRAVVLAGCETGASARSRPGWSVAEAFLAAGAQQVVATTRRVEDELAAQVGASVHSEGGDLAKGLVTAVREVDRQRPEADWAAFRVIVP